MRTTRPLACLLFVLPLLSVAQDKGFISGTLGYSRTASTEGDEDGPVNTTINLGPVVGFNMSEHIVLCAGLGWRGTSSETNVTFTDNNGNTIAGGTNKQSTNLITITPFVRYVKKVSDQVVVYGFGRVGLGFGTNKSELDVLGFNSKETADVMQVDVGVGPGIVYVMSPRWALNADWGLIGYTSTTIKPEDSDDESTSSTINAGFNPGAITFGLNWLF